jgi:hypothetical protein
MSSRYNAVDIEVLSGLDPVKRRPGMYTDTTRPNHLAQEVIEAFRFMAQAKHTGKIVVVHEQNAFPGLGHRHTWGRKRTNEPPHRFDWKGFASRLRSCAC